MGFKEENHLNCTISAEKLIRILFKYCKKWFVLENSPGGGSAVLSRCTMLNHFLLNAFTNHP